jgi:hypothetical protein
MIKDKIRITDMMCTMHSVLHRRYQSWGMILDLVIAAGSSSLLALTFGDPKILSDIGVDSVEYKYGVALSSIAVFLLSWFSLIIDWKGKSANHKQAFSNLAAIKQDLKREEHYGDISSQKNACEKADIIMNTLTCIPDPYFLSLKSMHSKKVFFSKIISKYPNANKLLLRFRCAIHSIKAAKDATIDA